MGTSLIGRVSKFFPIRAVPYGMEITFYHIRSPPLNATILLRTCVTCLMRATPMNPNQAADLDIHCFQSGFSRKQEFILVKHCAPNDLLDYMGGSFL